MVITIDGPAGAGKSTTAKLLAARLGYAYLDTGALYRAVAWKVNSSGIPVSNREELVNLLGATKLEWSVVEEEFHVLVDGEDITQHLRSPEMSRLASSVAALSDVREWLLPVQRDFGADGGVVAEGRDMGTRVFPSADVKFFLEADIDTRTQRRVQDVRQAGHVADPHMIQEDIVARDVRDRSREIAPLKPAPDAIIIDSSTLTVEQVVDKMMEMIPAQR